MTHHYDFNTRHTQTDCILMPHALKEHNHTQSCQRLVHHLVLLGSCRSCLVWLRDGRLMTGNYSHDVTRPHRLTVDSYSVRVRTSSSSFLCFQVRLHARMTGYLPHRSTSLSKGMMNIHCACLAKPTQLKLWASWEVFGRSSYFLSPSSFAETSTRSAVPTPASANASACLIAVSMQLKRRCRCAAIVFYLHGWQQHGI